MTFRSSSLRSAGALAIVALCGCAADARPLMRDDSGPGKADDSRARRDGGSDARASGEGGKKAGDDKPRPPRVYADCAEHNEAKLSDKQVKALADGGEPAALRILYPYDGTVFPRGLAAPVLMWDGVEGESEAVFVRLYSSTFQYSGCFVPEADGRLTLPQAVWDDAAAQTTGKTDPFVLELTVLRGNEVRGPISELLIIAPGSLKGSIFYNSYSSSVARQAGATGGAVLRIPPGGTAELFVGQRGCAGCHGASADGSRLVTNEGVYKLEPGGDVNPPALRPTNTEFPGVSADGATYAYQGLLVETDTGTPLLQSGLPSSASEVSFSPDGRWATFIDGPVDTRGNGAGGVNIPAIPGFFPGFGGSTPGSGASTGQGKLAVMRYDAQAKKLSEQTLYKDVSKDAQWPLFVPDDKAIVFTDTATNDLMILDLAAGKATLLARAMGFATPEAAQAKESFLPFADKGESRQAYFPTVAPVAAGGYFWVYFDSARRYGNFNTSKIESGLMAPSGIDVSQIIPIELPGLNGLGVPSKQLWVAAIEIAADGTYTEDPSAPAFYLPGQEMGSNNHRAFSALDPCLDEGQLCDSGTKCCSGFCDDKECVPPPDRCAQTEEACESRADCCSPTDSCIGGYCSVVIPI